MAGQIHWRSMPGSSTMGTALDIANRGQIRFRRTSADSCVVKLTISYEVPDVLAPLAGVRPTCSNVFVISSVYRLHYAMMPDAAQKYALRCHDKSC